MSNANPLVLNETTLNTPFAEAYRLLRANLNLTGIRQGMRSVLVTSAGSGEGKSTTAANLAIMLAQSGHRLILVDADFRRPGLHHLLPLLNKKRDGNGIEGFWQKNGEGAGPRPGLAELITGSRTFAEVMIDVQGSSNLWLVPTGVIPENPGELLASPRLRHVVLDLCDRADAVIVDSPPAALYSDAVELTRAVDGILYVLRSGPQRANHPRVLKQLQQSNAKLVGLVLNQVEGNPSGHYGAYHGGYGG